MQAARDATFPACNADLGGKTYCFLNKVAMTEFMKDPTGNLAKAQAYYSKL